MAGRSAASAWFAVGGVGALVILAVVYRGPLAKIFSTTDDTIDRSAEMTGFAQGLSTDGCHRDEVPLASGSSLLRQFVAADATCPAEVALFGIDRAAAHLQPPWSSSGDVVQASAGAPRMLNVVAHVVTLPLLTNAEMDLRVQRAETDAARANELFSTMRCGFNVTGQAHKVDVDPQHVNDVLYATCNATGVNALRTHVGFQNDALNAYYIVGSNNGEKGASCGNGVLIVASGSDNETLAHEIGHALSLRHFPLATENIMVSGTSVRNEFTLGQCYRCNFNPTSHASTNEAPGEPDCPAEDRNERCPEVWWPVTAPAPPPPGPSPEPSAAETVRVWLECEECTDNELRPVIDLGDRAIPLLRQQLDAPPPDRVRAHLQTTYQRLKPYADNKKITLRLSQDTYVSGYLANRTARLQLRAAIAAGRIQTPLARQLVRELRDNSRSDVRQHINRFLQ
jgi:hypothetical protein